jgi:hypothetical protein
MPVPHAVSAESAIVATQTIAADLHRFADTIAAAAGSLALYVETAKGSGVALRAAKVLLRFARFTLDAPHPVKLPSSGRIRARQPQLDGGCTYRVAALLCGEGPPGRVTSRTADTVASTAEA